MVFRASTLATVIYPPLINLPFLLNYTAIFPKVIRSHKDKCLVGKYMSLKLSFSRQRVNRWWCSKHALVKASIFCVWFRIIVALSWLTWQCIFFHLCCFIWWIGSDTERIILSAVVAFPGKLSVKSDTIKTAPVTKVSDVAPLIAIKNILWHIFHAQMGKEMGFILQLC